MITQLTVFLENSKGRLSDACRVIADGNINMKALFLSDTTDFGVARIFCDTPEKAAGLLNEAGHRAALTSVIAVSVPNEPGGLSKLLQYCDSCDMNIEYGYCFIVDGDRAIDVLKIDSDDAEEKLIEGGFTIVKPEEVYAI